ncbi:efflux RND transporter periplasmic adaptor subunit [Isoptericola sp. NPDC056134]|uniref:efflux RND transporter periplasmic adaptor subunit n=1 Tax=unclassified Isoptericola TaxID=2623355 RepID=UPI0035EA605B
MLLQRSRSSATPPSSGSPADPPAPDETASGAGGHDDGSPDDPGNGGPATRRGRVALRLRGRRPGRRAILVGAVAVVVVAALVVWFTVLRPRAAEPATAAAQTTTAQASTATFEQAVTTTGTLTPSVQEDVSFEASGTVQSVEVAEGDTVTKGQTLATIDTLQLDAALAQAKADLAQAEADLADARDADDGSDAAEAAVEARESAVAVAQQSADDADAAMSDATLKAPAAGVVTSVGVAVGDTVGTSSGSGSTSDQGGGSSVPSASGGSGGGASSGTSGSSDTADTAEFTIVGTDAWTVDVSVGEADVASIAKGDQVEMTSDDLTDTVFGTVSEIGRLPSTSQGAVAYPVTVAVTGDPEDLHDGVSVDVSIVTERRSDVLSVPAAAVSTGDDGASTVTLVGDDGSTTEQAVETGDTSGQLVEITSGLSEGDTVQYTTFTPGAGRGQGGGQGDLPEGFDPSQLRGGGQGGLPEGFDPSQMGGPGGGRGGNS